MIQLLGALPWIERIGWMLLHSVWLIGLVAMVFGLVDIGLRRSSANARYLAGCAALILTLAMMPIAYWVSPIAGASTPLAQVLDSGAAADTLLDVTELRINRAALPNAPANDDLVREPTSLSSISIEPANRTTEPQTMLMESATVPPTPAATSSSAEFLRRWEQLQSALRPWLPMLVGGWLLGAILLSLRPLLGWAGLRRLRSVGLSTIPATLISTVAVLSQRLGIKRSIDVLQSTLVEVPCVIGALKPVILLPASVLTGLSPEQLEAMLAHELAHIRRHDFVANVVQTLIETLLFYHPAIWWLSRRVRQEREHCCDDMAIAACGDTANYARMLVSVDALRGRSFQPSLAANGGSLVQRIRRLVPRPADDARSPWPLLVIMLGLVIAAGGLWRWPVAQAETSSSVVTSDEPSNTAVDQTQQPQESPKTESVEPAKDAPTTKGQGSGSTALPAPTSWPQFGGSSSRNNVSLATSLPTTWNLATKEHVKWNVEIGGNGFGSPVVGSGKILIGTNNSQGRSARYPKSVDLACLQCFDHETGKFLWQYSSEKLPAGRIWDWPLLGLCSTPCIEGDRAWFVSNRCEVVCVDLNGFQDNENDGPFREEPSTDKAEADVVWRFDMLKELGVRPLHQSCSSPTMIGDLVLLNTSNSVDESGLNIPAPDAPSFLALNRHTGHVVWSDASPGKNILNGETASSSPAVAELGGAWQAIFAGADGWLYAFDVEAMQSGQTKLLWKFDGNRKLSVMMVGSRGTRGCNISAPTIANGHVFLPMGRNPEHGEGPGLLWCIDPTKRGDISAELVFNKADPSTPIPHKRVQACEPDKGDFTQPNPNSGVIWHYESLDRNHNGKREFEESIHRAIGSVIVHENLAFIADLSGILHCFNAKTGQLHWTHDLMAAAWGSVFVADGKVWVGNEDGTMHIFRASAKKELLAQNEFAKSLYSVPAAVGNTLFVATKGDLIALQQPGAKQSYVTDPDDSNGEGRPRFKPEPIDDEAVRLRELGQKHFAAADYESMAAAYAQLSDRPSVTVEDHMWHGHAYQLCRNWPAAVKAYHGALSKLDADIVNTAIELKELDEKAKTDESIKFLKGSKYPLLKRDQEQFPRRWADLVLHVGHMELVELKNPAAAAMTLSKGLRFAPELTAPLAELLTQAEATLAKADTARKNAEAARKAAEDAKKKGEPAPKPNPDQQSQQPDWTLIRRSLELLVPLETQRYLAMAQEQSNQPAAAFDTWSRVRLSKLIFAMSYGISDPAHLKELASQLPQDSLQPHHQFVLKHPDREPFLKTRTAEGFLNTNPLNPFKATPLPGLEFAQTTPTAGSLAKLPDGRLLMAYATGDQNLFGIKLSTSKNGIDWEAPWDFAHNSIFNTRAPSLLVDDDGTIWMLCLSMRLTTQRFASSPYELWITHSKDGREWAPLRALQLKTEAGTIRTVTRQHQEIAQFLRLPGGRYGVLIGQDFGSATSPGLITDLSPLPLPIDKQQHVSNSQATFESEGRCHLVFDDFGRGLYYTRSDNMQTWSPLQRLAGAERDSSISTPQLLIEGDRVALIHEKNPGVYLQRGKLTATGLELGAETQITNHFMPLHGSRFLLNGDQVLIPSGTRPYVPNLLSASLNDLLK